MSQLTPISVIETALLNLRSEGYTHGVNGNATHPFGEQEKKHNWILRHPMRIVRLKRGETIPSNCKCGYPHFNRNNLSILHPGFEGNCHTIGS